MNYNCRKCSVELDEDDIVWAHKDGQLRNGGNDYVWCVSCLPNQEHYDKENA